MTNSTTDDFAEWLRLAEEALSAKSDDGRAAFRHSRGGVTKKAALMEAGAQSIPS